MMFQRLGEKITDRCDFSGGFSGLDVGNIPYFGENGSIGGLRCMKNLSLDADYGQDS
jgi:hypothetical protein